MSLTAWRHCCRPISLARRFHRSSVLLNLDLKYAEKICKLAEEKGLSLDDLKQTAKEKAKGLAAEEARKLRDAAKRLQQTAEASVETSSVPPTGPRTTTPAAFRTGERKDSSPVKVSFAFEPCMNPFDDVSQPLSSILNLSKLVSTPHTPEQISALWTTYHASKSGGTGRGFVCASIPIDLYRKMAKVGAKYPTFVVALPREQQPPSDSTVTERESTAYEFYFLQWIFHEAPPPPSATVDPFARRNQQPSPNPELSTVLFTPLQEYKLRGSFATPYLVNTHYTDLVSTNGVVLLRGEITPSAATAPGSGDGRYMMTQEDAQMLSMAVQKFYLWDSGDKGERDAERLLQIFHEKPEEFDWKELLKHSRLA
ncbi:hypothetical protein HGRIS_007435 [Hohenbuehelia grisea]|uniref:ATP11-domain-containing protein n=1 Tax=Hohenbuehelia grisea TaxID=104357 RepID=A0ABR3J4T4_9AGAR